jgi:anti-sigma regulatory factor (Ser/Thr protein kinase)
VGVVEISYELHSDRLVIEVTDEGEGFDPAAAAGQPDNLSEGGLGIAIIRAIADAVEIGAQPGGKGSRLRFEKALS